MKDSKGILRGRYGINLESSQEAVIALAGNPNTGKSTIFNNLTGMKQHTGNWPGKTVVQAQGRYCFENRKYLIMDLPGTYSLFANSPDEKVARDFICFAHPDATVVVADATCLERNLNMVLQVMEITPNVIVCLNLIDEAERKAIEIDVDALAGKLGVPVIPTAARTGRGIPELKKAIKNLVDGSIQTTPHKVAYDQDIEQMIKEIQAMIKVLLPEGSINSRWIALRVLDGDNSILDEIYAYSRHLARVVK